MSLAAIGVVLELSLIHIYVGNPGTEVRKVAVCSGGGGSRVSSALAEIADVYITGDVNIPMRGTRRISGFR